MADLLATHIPHPAPSSIAALLLLADGRLPAGGHAHSGGLEAAATLEGIHNFADLEAFLRGRMATTGAVGAAFAAAACFTFHHAAHTGHEFPLDRLIQLDRELEARIPSPVLRTVSRRLGKNMLRAGLAIWPHAYLDELARALGRNPHHPISLGVVAAAAGLTPRQAAAALLHDAVTGPAMAAVRLLGLDPLSVHAILGRLGPELDNQATRATSLCRLPPAELPAYSSPLLDLLAEAHATWEVRLFAS